MQDPDAECPFCESTVLAIRSSRDELGKEWLETVCLDCGRTIELDDFRDRVRQKILQLEKEGRR